VTTTERLILAGAALVVAACALALALTDNLLPAVDDRPHHYQEQTP